MRLPPLNALKAFEASVRLGGFTPAASELGVSPAAVSMQVRNAEQFLGKTLFHRLNNRLLLTDAGRLYYPAVSEALATILVATEDLVGEDTKSAIVVSTIQSLAEIWVAPAIARFRRLYPTTAVELRIEADPVDLNRSRTDLRITYESHLYPGNHHVPLFKDATYPFYSHAFGEANLAGKDLAQVPDHLLIHTDWGEGYASHPTWANWFRAAGLARVPDARKGLRVGGDAIAFALAREGVGVALVPKTLMDAKLAVRDEFIIDERGLQLPFSYFAILPVTDDRNGFGRDRAALVKDVLNELVVPEAGKAHT